MATSLRDRLLTPPVARAMMSPLGIVLAGAGAAVGIVTGLGPIGAAVIGAVAWGGRVAVAVPRGGPRQDRIDPFTLGEPWRFYVRDALQAEKGYLDAIRRSQEGPLRDRLGTIGERVHEMVRQCWGIARKGQSLADAARRIDVGAAQRQLNTLESRADERWMAGTSATETARALRAQIESAGRMKSLAAQAQTQLQVLNARMDEMVARTIELSVHADTVGDLSSLDTDVGNMLGDLEALRQAMDETSSVDRTVIPPEVLQAGLTDSGLTNPTLTDSGLTDPALTDSGLTDPALTDPALTDTESGDSGSRTRGGRSRSQPPPPPPGAGPGEGRRRGAPS